MTYLESADGIMITHNRAIKELRVHGITNLNEFYQELGKLSEYSATEVLHWLGY